MNKQQFEGYKLLEEETSNDIVRSLFTIVYDVENNDDFGSRRMNIIYTNAKKLLQEIFDRIPQNSNGDKEIMRWGSVIYIYKPNGVLTNARNLCQSICLNSYEVNEKVKKHQEEVDKERKAEHDKEVKKAIRNELKENSESKKCFGYSIINSSEYIIARLQLQKYLKGKYSIPKKLSDSVGRYTLLNECEEAIKGLHKHNINPYYDDSKLSWNQPEICKQYEQTFNSSICKKINYICSKVFLTTSSCVNYDYNKDTNYYNFYYLEPKTLPEFVDKVINNESLYTEKPWEEWRYRGCSKFYYITDKFEKYFKEIKVSYKVGNGKHSHLVSLKLEAIYKLYDAIKKVDLSEVDDLEVLELMKEVQVLPDEIVDKAIERVKKELEKEQV